MKIQVYRVEQLVRQDMKSALNAHVGIMIDYDVINHIINKNQSLKSMLDLIGQGQGELKDETFDIPNDAIREIFENALVKAAEDFIVSKL